MQATRRVDDMTKQIDVVGAVILHEGQVLCARRAPGATLAGMWEFPGGKVESGEPPEAALAREIAEELDCAITVGSRVTTTSHAYDFATVHLTTYRCALASGSPRAKEHAELAWVSADDLQDLEWAPADIPAVHLVQAALLS